MLLPLHFFLWLSFKVCFFSILFPFRSSLLVIPPPQPAWTETRLSVEMLESTVLFFLYLHVTYIFFWSRVRRFPLNVLTSLYISFHLSHAVCLLLFQTVIYVPRKLGISAIPEISAQSRNWLNGPSRLYNSGIVSWQKTEIVLNFFFADHIFVGHSSYSETCIHPLHSLSRSFTSIVFQSRHFLSNDNWS